MSTPQIPQITKRISAKSLDWHRVDIRVAVTETPPPRSYIVGHLPERRGIYGMLIGPDGSRKSWLALHIAIAVAAGREVAGGLWPAPERGRVVFFTGEDVAQEMWHRIHSVAQNEDDATWLADCDENLDIIPLADGADGLTLICPSDEKAGFAQHPDVAALIEYCKGARLIIIDPLADMVDASENDDVAARLLVQTLRSISRETGAGVLVAHHQNKAAMGAGEKHNQTSRGSSKIPAGARWSVTLQPLSDKEAKDREIFDQHFWTKVHEGKSSYSARTCSDNIALYHYPETTDATGKTVGGVPLARLLPVKEEPEAADGDVPKVSRAARKYRDKEQQSSGQPPRPLRGRANAMGVGADEFDARFADVPPTDPAPFIKNAESDDDCPF